MAGVIDLERLMEMAKNADMTGKMAATLHRFSERTSIQIPQWIKDLGHDNEANLNDCDMALNTVIG
jgi:Ser/Thr protein kinase RdoA (MazF antagonist)